MNKKEFLQQVAEKTNMSLAVADVFLDAVVDTLQNAVSAGNEVTLPGLGKFEAKLRPARTGRNPATGVAIAIPAKTRLRFKPSGVWALRLSTPSVEG